SSSPFWLVPRCVASCLEESFGCLSRGMSFFRMSEFRSIGIHSGLLARGLSHLGECFCRTDVGAGVITDALGKIVNTHWYIGPIRIERIANRVRRGRRRQIRGTESAPTTIELFRHGTRLLEVKFGVVLAWAPWGP